MEEKTKVPESWLPPADVNLFQGIKAKCDEAEAKGIKLYKMSVGQPPGAALLSARKIAAEAIMSSNQNMHEYADNGCPPCKDFAQRFVQAHLKRDLSGYNLAYMPTPGTKPMLGIIIKACCGGTTPLRVKTHTRPGYPTPAVQAEYWGVKHSRLPINEQNGFTLDPENLIDWSCSGKNSKTLIMLNFPHNPTGTIAFLALLRKICALCVKYGWRVFNDAAYAALAYNRRASRLLSEVAIEFPGLSWCECVSSSKILGNACNWRIGAMVGSPDFIADIARIKGETDSGFNSALAIGALYAIENDQRGIDRIRKMYKTRMATQIKILSEAGMRLAVNPQAGFFSLWKTPKYAYGQEIGSAEEFNKIMIANSGIVGVHFEPYIRYSTCAPLEDPNFLQAIRNGFNRAQIAY